MTRPLLTVGITTYKRPELLVSAVRSIERTNAGGRIWAPGELEIIVGNDDQSTPLGDFADLPEFEGVRVVNYPVNQRETGNMAELLRMAQAPFFTWLADDDEWASEFSAWARQLIQRDLLGTDVAVTSYGIIDVESRQMRTHGRHESPDEIWSGPTFLKEMLSSRLLVHTPSSLMRTERLRDWKGYEPLGESPVGLYGEFLLAVKFGTLPKIVVTNRPLYLYREHGASWGVSNQEVDLYERLGLALIARSYPILKEGDLRRDLASNFFHLIRHTLGNLVGKLKASGDFSGRRVLRYARMACQVVPAPERAGFLGVMIRVRWYAFYRIIRVTLSRTISLGLNR